MCVIVYCIKMHGIFVFVYDNIISDRQFHGYWRRDSSKIGNYIDFFIFYIQKFTQGCRHSTKKMSTYLD